MVQRSIKKMKKLILITTMLILYFSYYPSKFIIKIVKQNNLDISKSFSAMKFDFAENRLYASRKVDKVQCSKLFAGSASHIKEAKLISRKRRKFLTSEHYSLLAMACKEFIYHRGYITDYLTEEEREYPIAYSISLYKDVVQTERLLRAIYRPQNCYCIHIDKKANSTDRKAIESIANCFDNVFIAPQLINVTWGQYSVLKPDLICMKELLKIGKWKYYINLSGQEFPLKTNYQLVKILQAYNGANDVEGSRDSVYDFRWRNIIAPHNATPTKGSFRIVVNRDFVDYVIHNATAYDILQWAKKVFIPDEAYFSTLNHNPHLGIKGSYKGVISRNGSRKEFLARFVNWGNYPCSGKNWVHTICILGIGDLPLLYDRRELFVNKFHLNYEHFALDCLEELIYNRTREEYLNNLTFNDSYYKNLEFVKNKIS